MENQNTAEPTQTQIDTEKTHSPDTTGESQAVPRKKKGWGCLGCGVTGCIGIIALTIAVFLGFGYWVNNIICSKTPIEMPPTYLEPAEETLLKEKYAAWIQKMEENPGEPVMITLTDKEINSLFNDSLKQGKNWINIAIDNDDKTVFSTSAPITPQKSLFLNISGKGEITVVDEQFYFKLDKLTLGKFTIRKGEFLDAFVEGFFERIMESESLKKIPYTVTNLKVKNGVVNLEVKSVNNDSDKY
jgi:hypothetical protein